MRQLNKGYKYKGNMVLVEAGKDIGKNWTQLWFAGNSSIDDEDQNLSIATNHLHGDEVPEELLDAKTTAELMAKLLNFYFKGFLFVGNPDQLELFKTAHKED
jgi:hypothetical protein